jgi:hypothetical protein
VLQLGDEVLLCGYVCGYVCGYTIQHYNVLQYLPDDIHECARVIVEAKKQVIHMYREKMTRYESDIIIVYENCAFLAARSVSGNPPGLLLIML